MSRIYAEHPSLQQIVAEINESIKQEMAGRTFRAANELRNASLQVLRGQRSGRRYKVPGTYARQRDQTDGKMKNGRYYTASAPGEPPAVRTGMFRLSWQPNARIEDGKYVAMVESDLQVGTHTKYLLGELLEDGTSRMAPRPHHERIQEQAAPGIFRIYDEPYREEFR